MQIAIIADLHHDEVNYPRGWYHAHQYGYQVQIVEGICDELEKKGGPDAVGQSKGQYIKTRMAELVAKPDEWRAMYAAFDRTDEIIARHKQTPPEKVVSLGECRLEKTS